MNKLMARIFAVVMVVVMLGTVSFAAALTDFAAPDATDYGTQTVKTVLAFATDDKNAQAPNVENGDVIIAIDQLVGNVPTTIAVDDNLNNKDYVVIVFSGDKGIKDYALIDNRAKDVTLTELVVTANSATIEVNGQTYSNVVVASFSTTAAKEDGRKVKAYGAYFKQTDGDKTGANTSLTVPEKGNLIKYTLDEATAYTGNLEFSIAIVGAPANAKFEATPYISYE